MLLEDKVAIVYGAGGSMGGAITRAFADAGASVFLAGRNVRALETIVEEMRRAGRTTESAEVDVDNPDAVARHAEQVVASAGRIDISCNAVGMDAVQSVPLAELSLDDFMTPIDQAMCRHFITTTVAARQMSAQGFCVIVTLTASSAREWRHLMGGFSIACGAIETLTRTLAAEIGKHGVRVVCIRANFTPETSPDVPAEAIRPLVEDTLIGRLPLLAEVGAAAVFAASDRAGATTGAVLNLTCGAIVD
jgi:3-oxoacyl-[acyl-carrier protein] reductase